MKKMIALMLAAVLMMLCASCAMAQSEGILYRVTGGKNEMVLLGSIHVGSPEMYPLGQKITEALSEADTIVFECDTESPEALQATMKLMSYAKGDSLDKHISAQTYALLKETAEKTGYPLGMLLAYKPWAVVSLLAMETTAAEMGMEDISQAMELGVEKQIALLTEGKEIRYLETAVDQLEMMDGFSPELQEYMLYTSCNSILDPESISEADASLSLWPKWWAEGNADTFARNYQEGMENDPEPELMQEYHENLLVKRNLHMAKGLRELLESEEESSYFVTVGLLHLVLPQESIICELEKMGYSVEKIMN